MTVQIKPKEPAMGKDNDAMTHDFVTMTVAGQLFGLFGTIGVLFTDAIGDARQTGQLTPGLGIFGQAL